MRVHIGFDIGTTNTKCLVLAENGSILSVRKERTPRTLFKGEEFFDIELLEAFVDSAISELAGLYQIASIGFSTIGESVVPVKNGRAASAAPLWNAYSVTSADEDRKRIELYAKPEIIGTADNPLFSIHKILWMKENIRECADAEMFLPLSSYFCYRKTGVAAWDYSQAARSGMFDVKSRSWIHELLSTFDIHLPESILPMGSSMGSADGIVYGLGGHDHIVGFFGIERILSSEDKAIYYSSMGTSEVLATIVPSSSVSEISSSNKSYISPSFTSSSYIATRSFRSFGSMLKSVMNISGYSDDFDSMNGDIAKLRSKHAACLFSQNGDFISSGLIPDKLYISELDKTAGRAELAEAAYLYLSAVSELMRADLESVFSLSDDFIFAAGGRIIDNCLFMSYLAAAINHPISLLETEEISALGAALVGLSAYSADELRRICSLFQRRTIDPDPELRKLCENTIEIYRDFRK